MTQSIIDKIVALGGHTLPDGFDSWGLKSVGPDLTSYANYQWMVGKVHTASCPDVSNTDPCPNFVGDGLCVAKTWSGMASGSYVASTLLLVAYNSHEVLGESAAVMMYQLGEHKLRVRRVAVVAVLDGAALFRNAPHADYQAGSGADLRNARFDGMEFKASDFSGANLAYASFNRGKVRRSTFRNAILRNAVLQQIYLFDVDMSDADLVGSNFTGAALFYVNFQGANLCGAALNHTQVQECNFEGARYNPYTVFPERFDPANHGMIET